MTPSLFVAFAAGALSFFSPCILPLLPVYLAVLGTGDGLVRGRITVFARAFLFVLGFTVVFVLLGLGASAAGRLLIYYRNWWMFLGGVLVLLFGLHQTGLLRWSFLYRERRMALPAGGSSLTVFLMGMVFATGWTPCVGPVLAGILTLAASAGRAAHGAVLLAVYSLGLGLPFLLASLGYTAIRRRLEAASRVVRGIELAGGVLLILLGCLLILGKSDWLMTAR